MTEAQALQLFEAYLAGYRKCINVEGKGIVTSVDALSDEVLPYFQRWLQETGQV